MAGPAGFEPTIRESKSLALPLGYGPNFYGAADGSRTHHPRARQPAPALLLRIARRAVSGRLTQREYEGLGRKNVWKELGKGKLHERLEWRKLGEERKVHLCASDSRRSLLSPVRSDWPWRWTCTGCRARLVC